MWMKLWMLAELALLNVRRNRSRTALSLGAIGFGVLMTLFLGGFAQGFVNLLVDDTIQGRSGALQVHKRGYFDVRDNQPLDYDLEQGGALEARIRAVPGVTAVTPRLVFSGLVSNGTDSTLVVATALNPATYTTVFPLLSADLKGQPVSVGVPRGGNLGKDLAEALRVKDGDTVVFQAGRKGGRQNALDLDIVGRIDNGNPIEGKRVAYVPLAWAQELLGLPGRVTEYAVAVKSRDDVPAVVERMKRALGDDYEVQSWRELRPNIADVEGFVRVILTTICLIFLIIAIIGVVNTMLMSVLERTREIGTMMAVGITRGKILGLFLAEAATLAIIGSTLGAALGGGIVYVIASRGGVGAKAPGTELMKYIVPVTPPELVLLALGATLVGTVLAGLYPAWRASRLRPVEALRAN